MHPFCCNDDAMMKGRACRRCCWCRWKFLRWLGRGTGQEACWGLAGDPQEIFRLAAAPPPPQALLLPPTPRAGMLLQSLPGHSCSHHVCVEDVFKSGMQPRAAVILRLQPSSPYVADATSCLHKQASFASSGAQPTGSIHGGSTQKLQCAEGRRQQHDCPTMLPPGPHDADAHQLRSCEASNSGKLSSDRAAVFVAVAALVLTEDRLDTW